MEREDAVNASLAARQAYIPSRDSISSSLLNEFAATPSPGLSLATAYSQLAARIQKNPNWRADPAIAEACCQLLNQAIYAGQQPGDEDYERALAWLMEIVEVSGRFGERPGPLEQWMSLDQSLVNAALHTALLGDYRLKDQSFFAFLPLWTMHQVQPDSDQATRKAVTKFLIGQSQLYPSPNIQWWLENVPQPPIHLKRFDAVTLPADFPPPPSFGFYPQAAVVLWRSSWAPGADGLVTHGALADDAATCLQAGNVSWTPHAEPVLVLGNEATQGYAIGAEPNEDGAIMASLIPASSVIRVGENQPEPGRAPIIVRELNDHSGNLRVNASELFPQLSIWHRDLFWKTGGELRIIDTISYDFGKRDRTSFFWRLSATEPVSIETDRKRTIVEWGENAIVFQGNTPLEVDQFLVPVSATDPTPQVVIRLRTIGRPHSLRLLTRVLPRENVAPEEVVDMAKIPASTGAN